MKHKQKHSSKAIRHRKETIVPMPEDIHKFLKAVDQKVKKRAAKFYKKRPKRSEHTINFLLKKHKLKGTNTEQYWKLKGLCVLKGKESSYLEG